MFGIVYWYDIGDSVDCTAHVECNIVLGVSGMKSVLYWSTLLWSEFQYAILEYSRILHSLFIPPNLDYQKIDDHASTSKSYYNLHEND